MLEKLSTALKISIFRSFTKATLNIFVYTHTWDKVIRLINLPVLSLFTASVYQQNLLKFKPFTNFQTLISLQQKVLYFFIFITGIICLTIIFF